ncbi:flagellar basal body-associated FliL family protein [bacterium]|nr:flagellar basal body-associated FliL family protein [bacterium]MBU1637497.1 flagellar basal body-associated FliL family protein [bacterium]MBU1919885.1 flagellar basal body-associated FliL family protein [bacterium]RQV98022.1 MAG: flagellar basal body-associated FliL family protein [bacterium]
MAEEKAKAPKTAEEEPQPEAEPKPKSKLPLMKYLIIAGVVLLQIAGSYFLQKSLFFDNTAQAEIAEVERSDEGHGEDHGEKTASGAPIIIMLDEIVVNPAGTEGRRYLATRLGLQTQSDSAETEITARSVLIRDAVLSLLSSKSMAQLSSLTYRDSLRNEIRDTVNKQLAETVVETVVFADYVLQ